MTNEMSRQRFQLLAWPDQLIWELRLIMQWGVSLNDVVRFWFSDRKITAVEQYRRNCDGSLVVHGHSVARKILGKYEPKHRRTFR